MSCEMGKKVVVIFAGVIRITPISLTDWSELPQLG
jgi:hypothetical protein